MGVGGETVEFGPGGEAGGKAMGRSDLVQLLKATAAVVSASADVHGAFQWAVDVVCRFTQWPLGHTFIVDPPKGVLRSNGVWHNDDEARYAPFVRATETATFARGEGLPGRILASAAPAWITDVRSDPNFPRAEAAAGAGLGAGFGFPVTSARGVEGVMEFFAMEPVAPDTELLELIAHVGLQLGHLLDRTRAEEALRDSEARLAESERVGRAGSWSWAVGEATVTWSAELYRIYGVDAAPGPVTYDAYVACIHPADRAQVGDLIAGILETLEPYEHEYRIVRPDGQIRWVHARVGVVEAVEGVPRRLAGHCQDVTERRLAEDARRLAQLELESHQRILERIARTQPVGPTLEELCHDVEARYDGVRCSVLLVDETESVLRHAAAPSLSNSFRQAIDGLPIADGSGACGTAAARNQPVVVADTLVDPLTKDFVDIAREHSLRSVWSHPLTTSDGAVIGTFAMYRAGPYSPDEDEVRTVMTAGSLAALALERGRTQAALVTAANIDPLTGLANRARFLDSLSAALADISASVAVMFLDLDGFKWINDSLGHPAGDAVLTEVAERLQQSLRPPYLVARFGGDEFTVLLEQATDAEIERAVADVAAAFEEPFPFDGGEFFLSCSVGIARSDQVSDASGLIRDADAAMFSAKEAGRARHAMFDERLRARAVGRVTLAAELRRAIARDEFVMHYQPIVDLHTGAWIGAEGLVRWAHPSRGLVMPDEFIPLAEEDGFIVPLGLRILDMVVGDRAAWSDAEGVYVSVNVSVVQLTDPSLSATIAASLRAHGLAPDCLVVEVTETALMQQLEPARQILEAIGASGVQVVIDDFGAGYSSIGRLEQLPITGVKIDNCFTKSLGVVSKAGKMVGAMAELAHALDLKVVVEGIETAAALATARDVGCDAGQGYYFAPPVPGRELADLLGRARLSVPGR